MGDDTLQQKMEEETQAAEDAELQRNVAQQTQHSEEDTLGDSLVPSTHAAELALVPPLSAVSAAFTKVVEVGAGAAACAPSGAAACAPAGAAAGAPPAVAVAATADTTGMSAFAAAVNSPGVAAGAAAAELRELPRTGTPEYNKAYQKLLRRAGSPSCPQHIAEQFADKGLQRGALFKFWWESHGDTAPKDDPWACVHMRERVARVEEQQMANQFDFLDEVNTVPPTPTLTPSPSPSLPPAPLSRGTVQAQSKPHTAYACLNT